MQFQSKSQQVVLGGFFVGIDKFIPKLIWKGKGARRANTILTEKRWEELVF
jgi:hypothetical protein